MRDALGQLRRYAAHDHACILLEGERVCGKTVLARYVHDLSPRPGRPFRTLSLAAADDALVSSDLFGHAKGAFTGADSARAGAIVSATGGTLFLDEIGKASPVVQGRLLHVVEEAVSSIPSAAIVPHAPMCGSSSPRTKGSTRSSTRIDFSPISGTASVRSSSAFRRCETVRATSPISFGTSRRRALLAVGIRTARPASTTRSS